MRDAQQEIKSTVSVNTTDMASKAHGDKDNGKDIERFNRRKGCYSYNINNLLKFVLFCIYS